jgi:hypothetical protein
VKKFLNVLENLQNAFRMPDGASEMTRNLASLDFPQLTSVLPYRDYDRDSGLFVNRSTVGFLLRAEPLSALTNRLCMCWKISSKASCRVRRQYHSTWCPAS